CLQGLQAVTLDDGTALKVRASRAEGGTPAGPLRISGPKGELEAPGCVLSYAYWLPSALRSQKRLLNPQTGELEPVSVSPQGSEAVEAGPQRLSAQKLRISAPPGPIDLLTTPQGDWLGLDARVRGGRLLSYRLREAPGGASSGGARPVASLDAP
ncbi:MAG: hypothetical protein RL722_2407, partial [Pseudomonadota bacterium]